MNAGDVTILGGPGYRLPTEAEWEYACRAGDSNNFPFRDDAQLGRVAWMWSNCERMTHPVGEKEHNSLGLYDMYGNVWEWCWDRFGYYPTGLSVDPSGPAIGTDRVLRGSGWWNGTHKDSRPSFRLYHLPESTSGHHDFGFRVATGGIGGLPTITVESHAPTAGDKPSVTPAIPRPPAAPAPVTVTFRQGLNGYLDASGLWYVGSTGLRLGETGLWTSWGHLGEPFRDGSISILRFDKLFSPEAGGIPPGSTIKTARLRVVTPPDWQGNGATVHRLKRSIDFQDVLKTLLKENAKSDRSEVIAPATATIGNAFQPGVSGTGPIGLDVTADVQAWASGVGNHGWAFLPGPTAGMVGGSWAPTARRRPTGRP